MTPNQQQPAFRGLQNLKPGQNPFAKAEKNNALASHLLGLGGPFSGIVGSLLKTAGARQTESAYPVAAALAEKNAQEQAASARQAQQQAWNQRLNEAALNRQWKLEDEERANNRADMLLRNTWAREDAAAERDYQNKMALQLLGYRRENDTAALNRQWKLEDEERANNRADMLLRNAWAREDRDNYLKQIAPTAAKKLNAEDFQLFLKNPQAEIVHRSWYNPAGILGRRDYVKIPAQSAFANVSDEDLLKGL